MQRIGRNQIVDDYEDDYLNEQAQENQMLEDFEIVRARYQGLMNDWASKIKVESLSRRNITIRFQPFLKNWDELHRGCRFDIHGKPTGLPVADQSRWYVLDFTTKGKYRCPRCMRGHQRRQWTSARCVVQFIIERVQPVNQS